MTPAREPHAAAHSPDNAPAVHLLIPTHTTRHLAACLAAIAAQTRPPSNVVLTCDTDDPALVELAADLWAQVARNLIARSIAPPPLTIARRAHQGEARLNQTRNNGLRALDASGLIGEHDLVVVLDGDTLLAPEALDQHARLGAAGFEVIIPYRINLDPETSDALTRELLLSAEGGSALGRLARPQWLTPLAARQRRYQRQLFLRRLPIPLTKRHKPKLLGGHHALSVRLLRLLNGYDEEYTGYGYDDDDLSRRLHALRPPPRAAIAVRDILAYHLWHPTRAPARPTDAPGYTRFRRPGLPMAAAHGWRNPLPQPLPRVDVIDGTGTSPVRAP